jgi:LPXTG-motif cell wall-anchored protein
VGEPVAGEQELADSGSDTGGLLWALVGAGALVAGGLVLRLGRRRSHG